MEPTREEMNIATRIIKDLLERGFEYELRHYYSDDDHKNGDWFRENHKYLEEKGIYHESGATKLVLICKELSNWVIKLNFRDGKINFCDREVENYIKACDAGLGEYFAATYKIGAVEGVKVYLQRKACVDPDSIDDYFRDAVMVDFEDDEANEDDIEEAMDMLEDGDRLVAIFGNNSAVAELVDFIFENEIDDLHSCNFGFVNEKPVIIDFSGYSVGSC